MAKSSALAVELDFDTKFFAIVPAVNLNFHGGFTFEIEWLFFGVYIFKIN